MLRCINLFALGLRHFSCGVGRSPIFCILARRVLTANRLSARDKHDGLPADRCQRYQRSTYNVPRLFWITTGMIALRRVSFHSICQEQEMLASDLSSTVE